MVKYTRVKGGEKNELSGKAFTRIELEKIYDLFIEIDGIGIRERNPKIHLLAKKLKRTVRSVENQLLGFRLVFTGTTGRANYNKLIKKIWDEKSSEDEDEDNKLIAHVSRGSIEETNPALVETLSMLDYDFNCLRKKVLKDNNNNTSSKRKPVSISDYRIRSIQIKKYALLRSGGICEKCENSAPFKNKYGTPFLEVHHISSLSDDGPDHPNNVAAVCPNCHKEAHFSREAVEIREDLIKKILDKEKEINLRIK